MEGFLSKNKKNYMILWICFQIFITLTIVSTRDISIQKTILSIYLIIGIIYSHIAFNILSISKITSTLRDYGIATVLFLLMMFMDYFIIKFKLQTSFIIAILEKIAIFFIIDSLLQALTQYIGNSYKYRRFFIVVSLINLILISMDNGLFVLGKYLFYVDTAFTCFYPLIFFIQYYKKIRNYGKHMSSIVMFFVISNIIFFIVSFFMNVGNNNFDVYTYLLVLEGIITYLSLKSVGFYKKIIRINYMDFIELFFLIALFHLTGIEYIKIIFMVISFYIIKKEVELYLLLTKKNIGRVKKEDTSMDNIIENKLYQYELEELNNNRMANFLHDDILQDLIVINMELGNSDTVNKDSIKKPIEKLIGNIRGKIDLFNPNINYSITLKDNYSNLINSLRERFNNKNILIDFLCNEEIYLSYPYDVVIYRIIHESVVNIYKHSKGNYSEIELLVKNRSIFVNITNFGDYLDLNILKGSKGVGLKVLKKEVESLNGIFNMDFNTDNEEETEVKTKIIIPIIKEVMHENFINR